MSTEASDAAASAAVQDNITEGSTQMMTGSMSPVAEELVAAGAVSVEEACAFTGLSRSTLYALMERGELPFCKVGRSRRVPRLALRKLLAEGFHG